MTDKFDGSRSHQLAKTSAAWHASFKAQLAEEKEDIPLFYQPSDHVVPDANEALSYASQLIDSEEEDTVKNKRSNNKKRKLRVWQFNSSGDSNDDVSSISSSDTSSDEEEVKVGGEEPPSVTQEGKRRRVYTSRRSVETRRSIETPDTGEPAAQPPKLPYCAVIVQLLAKSKNQTAFFNEISTTTYLASRTHYTDHKRKAVRMWESLSSKVRKEIVQSSETILNLSSHTYPQCITCSKIFLDLPKKWWRTRPQPVIQKAIEPKINKRIKLSEEVAAVPPQVRAYIEKQAIKACTKEFKIACKKHFEATSLMLR